MEIKELISITGKNGLYKVVAQSARGFIVESIDDKKVRMPVNANQQVALLDEITIYTEGEESLTLKSVFENMQKKEAEGPIPTAKDNPVAIRDFFKEIAPGYDQERVYISDMKKILKWYEIISAIKPNTPSES